MAFTAPADSLGHQWLKFKSVGLEAHKLFWASFSDVFNFGGPFTSFVAPYQQNMA